MHTHDRMPAASRHTRRIMAAVLVPAALATVVAMLLLWPGRSHVVAEGSGGDGVRASGTVVALTVRSCPAGGSGTPACGTATVRVTRGPGTGKQVVVDLPQGPGAARVAVGDGVVLLYAPDAVPGGPAYTIVDHQRGAALAWLVALTAVVVVALGRWRGLASLAGLGVGFAVLLLFIVPAILDGKPPLLVAVVGAAAIMFAALYLTNGISVHTSVAVGGTLASLVLTGALGAAFTAALHLTGVASDDDAFLASVQGSIDMRGLLLAGVMIGALGVLAEVTVTQAVTVAEMAAAGPTTRWGLYRAAGRVGRAHVGSAVNTIVLAYAGTSLPLLLLFATGSQPTAQVLTGEAIAQEILRSAVGTIGLVAAVPITTALAALVADLHSGPVTGPAPAGPRHAATAR